MSNTASEREPRWRAAFRYVAAVVAVSLPILLVLDILDQGETLAGDVVFWVWFVSAAALLVLGLGLLLSRTAVRLGALATGMALASFGLWALVTVVIL
jgi:hypothetical protein